MQIRYYTPAFYMIQWVPANKKLILVCPTGSVSDMSY